MGKERTACGTARKCVIIILKQRVACIRHSIGAINLSGLKCHGKCVAVRDGANRNLIKSRFPIPVGFIFFKLQFFPGCKRYDLIRSGSCYDAILCNARLHINDTSIRVGKIVQKRRFWNLRFDCDCLTFCRNGVNHQISSGTLMNLDQMFQTFFYCFSIHFSSAGKRNIVPQCDDPGQIIRIFIFGCQPWLNFHGIGIMKQRFPNSISDTGPAGIGIMRIDIGFLIFRVKSGITKYKYFFAVLCLRTVRTFLTSTSGKQTAA